MPPVVKSAAYRSDLAAFIVGDGAGGAPDIAASNLTVSGNLSVANNIAANNLALLGQATVAGTVVADALEVDTDIQAGGNVVSEGDITALSISSNVTSAGRIERLLGPGAEEPTIAPGTRLGVAGATALIAGYNSNDMAGAFRLTMNNAEGGSGPLATFTFANPRTTKPTIVLQPLNDNARNVITADGVYITDAVGSAGNWTGFTIDRYNTTMPLGAGAQYDYAYQVS